MQQKSNMGFSALLLIGIQGALLLLDLFQVFPYFRTLFFPAFLLMAGMIGMVGYFERDEKKSLSLIAMILSAGGLIWWTIMLIGRLSAG